ncbi:hypothetical protein PG985_012515 [Apiospora marii]|uniref:FAS1 domain-containing protein n=1 Tax=Apiospora marii TaxID=335849 RepID=A0ABR1RD33_9PEZI
MKPDTFYYFHLLAAVSFSQGLAHSPILAGADDSRQHPIMASSDQPRMQQNNVMLSDVMGRDRSINLFASLTRDVASIEQRLEDSSQNSTVLAPLNSKIDALPQKPWEDARDYEAFGTAAAYEGDEGRDRAQKNLKKFGEAHVLPLSPWQEGEKVKSLLAGDKEIWWENKDGMKVIQPEGIEVDSVAGKVANGEVWIIRGVRNYA